MQSTPTAAAACRRRGRGPPLLLLLPRRRSSPCRRRRGCGSRKRRSRWGRRGAEGEEFSARSCCSKKTSRRPGGLSRGAWAASARRSSTEGLTLAARPRHQAEVGVGASSAAPSAASSAPALLRRCLCLPALGRRGAPASRRVRAFALSVDGAREKRRRKAVEVARREGWKSRCGLLEEKKLFLKKKTAQS